jgi:hypothetical protein
MAGSTEGRFSPGDVLGLQDLIRRYPGVITTRVSYSARSQRDLPQPRQSCRGHRNHF